MSYVGRPHQGAWLVYLNGIEVPCVNIVVGYGVAMIPEATFSFPPHRLLQRLGCEDRMEVVAFFLDDLANPELPEFKLLFEGELLGWSYGSSGSSRTMNFNAVADISMFTQLHFFFLNNVDTIAGHVTDPASTVSGLAQPGAQYPFSLFKKGLFFHEQFQVSSPPQPDITKPFEIIFNVVRAMTDKDQDPARMALPAVNFFARWARKRNFINRFAALPMFEDETPDGTTGVFPILQAVQSVSAIQTAQQHLVQSVGDAGTMWEVLNNVYSHMFFEVAMLPTAPCARVRLSDGTILGSADTAPSSKVNQTREPLRLLNYFVKPQMFFGMAPTCNVFFPSMITNYSYSESYLAQPTRTYVNDQFISSVLKQGVFTAAALTFGYPPEVDAVLRAKSSSPVDKAGAPAANPALTGKNMLIFPEEFFKGPVIHRMGIPAWFTYLKNKEPITASNVHKKPSPATTEEAAALHTLMQSYVAYEHQRARYEKRGGAVNLAWNPYVVPGFPCVIFDSDASAFHTIGYLSNVQHTLSLDGMSTAVNYGMARTLPEMFDLLKTEILASGNIYGSAPTEPINSIRDIIQDFTKADQFYNALLFQRQPMSLGKKASFDFREVVGYAGKDGKVDPIVLSKTVTTETLTYDPGLGAPRVHDVTNTSYVNTLDGTRDVVPLPAFAPVFNQYDTAMQYVSRPICTLIEYLQFLHGEKTLEELLTTDVSIDGNTTPPQVERGDDRFGEKVVYFKRIRRLIQGPGPVPSPAEVGVTSTTDADGATEVVAYDGIPSGVVEYVQTRFDWDTILENYRSEMYSRKGPLK